MDFKLRDNIFSLFDQGTISATTFLASVILARNVGKDDFGIFGIALSTMIFINIVHAAFIGRPMNVMLSTMSKPERIKYFSSTVRLQLFLFIFLSLFIAITYSTLFENMSVSFISIVILFTMSFQLRETIRHNFNSNLKFDLAFYSSLVYLGTSLILIFIFLFFGYLNSYTTLVSLSIPTYGLVFLYFQEEYITKKNNVSFYYALKINFNFSKWELLGSLCNYGYRGIIPVIMGLQNNFFAAAGYTAVKALIGPLQILIVSIYNVLLPKACSVNYSNKGNQIRLLRNNLIFVLIVTIPIIFFMMALSEKILEVFYGYSYSIYSNSLKIFSLYIIFLATNNILFAFFISNQLPIIKGISQFIGLVSSFVYMFNLNFTFNVYKGTLITLIGEFFSFLFMIIILLAYKIKLGGLSALHKT